MPLNGLLAAQEMFLNRFLQLDPEAINHLTPLSGKVIRVELNVLSHYWLFTSDAIHLTKDYNGLIDLVVRGSFFDFIRLGFMKRESTAIPIQVSGDMEFAKQFQDLFANLEIDWEEQLSRVVGDTIAYPLARFLKSMHHWARHSTESMAQNITDYLQAEIGCLVAEEEIQIFCSDVDDLRDQVARLQARIERLQRE